MPRLNSSKLPLLLLLSTRLVGLTSAAAADPQRVLSAPSANQDHHQHPIQADSQEANDDIEATILALLEEHDDPVDVFVALSPEAASVFAQPRLLQVFGEPEAQWMTEGDKMRLHRQGKKFVDLTDHHEFYDSVEVDLLAGKAHLPPLVHQRYVKPLFPKVSTQRMHDVLEHMTGYYTRYFGSTTGERSALWLHDHIAEIIKNAPFHTHISLQVFTHSFPQPSIIARFEPKVTNFSAPLTILGAHQDSMNYLFPLLPAPGADDDCSGTVSILEAFRVLAESGYTPENGPVEFHWYAGEEGGLLGSQPVARYKKESGATIGAMMEFDMTAFVARNATESIGFIETESDAPLTKWALDLAKEYISIDSAIYTLPAGAGSDYMSFTQLGYPATFASEGNPSGGGGSMGEYDPYVHGVKDTMDVDDENGYFSIDHMARFSELAIAFVVEQAGWDNKWR